jgi:formate hydrogenlyase subunit 3/multisubunit Na+/H+ antiporter MnhD subunit
VLFLFLLTGKARNVVAPTLLALAVILAAGVSFTLTCSLFVFFVSFELLLLAALFLLRLTSKSERVDEAVAEMAF